MDWAAASESGNSAGSNLAVRLASWGRCFVCRAWACALSVGRGLLGRTAGEWKKRPGQCVRYTAGD